MIVHATESPNTDTTRPCLEFSCTTGTERSDGSDGDTAAADAHGASAPDRRAVGTMTIVTAIAVATVAPASRSNGTRAGRQRRMGCSISQYDTAASASVARHRTANKPVPDQPVRSPLSTR